MPRAIPLAHKSPTVEGRVKWARDFAADPWTLVNLISQPTQNLCLDWLVKDFPCQDWKKCCFFKCIDTNKGNKENKEAGKFDTTKELKQNPSNCPKEIEILLPNKELKISVLKKFGELSVNINNQVNQENNTWEELYIKKQRSEEESRWRRNRTGDHFLFYKFIERTTERWTKFTKQLLIASSRHRAPRKAAHCLPREVEQGYWRSKRETREWGTETRPGKGVLLEEVSNHQETLALAGPGEAFKSQRAT